jgi:hypothetical protein
MAATHAGSRGSRVGDTPLPGMPSEGTPATRLIEAKQNPCHGLFTILLLHIRNPEC